MVAFWRRASQTATAVSDHESTESAPPPSFRSRALTQLLESRPTDRPWEVLDLGAPNQQNLMFFGRRSAHYGIEDLHRSLEPVRRGLEYDLDKAAALEGWLRFEADRRFDLVLAWDLLNYLPRGLLELIDERLAPHCHPRTEFYALLAMEEKIPAQPGRPTVIDDETIRLDGWEGPRTRSWDRHTTTVLTDSMPHWTIDRTFLLKVHMHEVLLEAAASDP